jgi:urease accessory protein
MGELAEESGARLDVRESDGGGPPTGGGLPGAEVGALVVTEAHVDVTETGLVGRVRDGLVLTAEERRWGRRRVRTRGGRELVLALPTGSVLMPGDVLHVGPDWYLVLEAAEESVIAVVPRSREQAIRIAFEVGNRHFPLAIDGERLLVPDDTAMDQLLTRLAASWNRTRAVFLPVGAGHRHDH